jgi:hypothetical protein
MRGELLARADAVISVLGYGSEHHEFTRQVHPAFTERSAAHARLRIIDALPKINAHGFAFARRLAAANKLPGVLPSRQFAAESLALLHQMNP